MHNNTGAALRSSTCIRTVYCRAACHDAPCCILRRRACVAPVVPARKGLAPRHAVINHDMEHRDRRHYSASHFPRVAGAQSMIIWLKPRRALQVPPHHTTAWQIAYAAGTPLAHCGCAARPFVACLWASATLCSRQPTGVYCEPGKNESIADFWLLMKGYREVCCLGYTLLRWNPTLLL